VIEGVPLVGINFTVLETGVCVSITEEDKVEIFSAKTGATSIKSISDDSIRSDMHLCRAGGIQFAQGSKLFSFSMKK
jgi:hypothetical protein